MTDTSTNKFALGVAVILCLASLALGAEDDDSEGLPFDQHNSSSNSTNASPAYSYRAGRVYIASIFLAAPTIMGISAIVYLVKTNIVSKHEKLDVVGKTDKDQWLPTRDTSESNDEESPRVAYPAAPAPGKCDTLAGAVKSFRDWLPALPTVKIASDPQVTTPHDSASERPQRRWLPFFQLTTALMSKCYVDVLRHDDERFLELSVATPMEDPDSLHAHTTSLMPSTREGAQYNLRI